MDSILKIQTLLVFLLGIYHDAEAIHGGHVAKLGELQYTVLLSIRPKTTCTGAVISDLHILTAGNCVWKRKTSDISILIGNALDITDESKWYTNVETITIHEEFKAVNYDPPWCRMYLQKHCSSCMPPEDLNDVPENDIAILTLADSLPLGNNVVSIAYKPIANVENDCSTCILAGWGKDNLHSRSIHLHWTTMSILSPEECKRREAHHRDKEFCAMDLSRKSVALEGDTGSALVCNDYAVGILSTMVPHVDYPATFVKISDYLDFIEAIVNRQQSSSGVENYQFSNMAYLGETIP